MFPVLFDGERTNRRLAAVLAADMVGYSRLMERDEQGILARLRAHRIELIDPTIAKNNGRIIKTTGDGMLVEFQSVVDAVNCAVEVQRRMRRRNSDVPEESRIQFRIGINLGDIIIEDDDIFGDGVNIAVRIEQLAESGGICVTASVHDQVSGRVEIDFDDLGEKQLKNISRPLKVYRAVIDELARAVAPAGGATQIQSVAKPTIAVLPFTNMSGDAEQEFFVDGLTEDILTELSRRHELFVISRNSTFVYKGQAVSITDVAKKLGAQYIVEGSVRKSGDRLRVTVQLIDTSSDTHIWAERYDRKLDDIFALQDEMTSAIVATLPGRLEAAQNDQLSRKKPASLAAYECVLVAKVLHHRSNREDNAKAQNLICQAITLDPEYAHAYAWRGCIMGQAWGYGWCDEKEETFAIVEADLERALNLDDNDADVHRILAAVHIMRTEFERARYHQERALALNPNYDLVVVQMGELFTWLGVPAEGVKWIEKAMRLNPHHPPRFWSHLGKAHFTAKDYALAIKAFMSLPTMDVISRTFVAICHACLGDQTAADAHVAAIRVADPTFNTETFLAAVHYSEKADQEHLREGLIKAGMD
ncbi:adenylate/guanylate cyclase domain-containing protein [Mesorhizobium sp. NBSH29]|uniref:adenylate/guanylate cyclase domain-containing protein n=1 Tax=Mesorhizobium sp. NBSH29 TaxID=2654249 RepID=UPI0018968DE9|nr:adenylate/guanylate cyclase domain-containing protein [Mesorhizobium sp. NBSH29]QPC88289.1 adenylate/guanylate cyclase domain-containing protein [Mesorhizobium sp. NBSH29]